MLARLIISASLIAALAAPAAATELPVRVAAGEGIIVRAESGMEALAAEVADEAPEALERIYGDLAGLPRPRAIEIRLVKESAGLQDVAPGEARVPDWAAGVAFPRHGVVAVATRRGPNPIDVLSTTVHELAHLSLGAALGNRAPRWLDEGFAYLHSSDFSIERAQTLTGMAWSGDRYLLYELERGFPPGENQAGRAYAQSYDFVGYLARRGRYADKKDEGDREPFRQFLAEMSAGASVRAAALDAYGVNLDTLEAEWWQTLRERYMWSFVGLFSLFVWVVGAFLLMIAWWRRRRQNRRRLAQWAIEEAGLEQPPEQL